MPTSIGRTLLRNGWPNRANTNGSTGRMQGLRIVSRPSTKARIKTLMTVAWIPIRTQELRFGKRQSGRVNVNYSPRIRAHQKLLSTGH